MASLTLNVQGMTCEHCQKTVTKALEDVAGTFGASVFLDDGEAEVDFDPAKASADAYIAAVQAAGYTASVKS
jgi:copper chaperone